MKDPMLALDIARRTALFTMVAGGVLGVAYSALLFVVAFVIAAINNFEGVTFFNKSGRPIEIDWINLSSMGDVGLIVVAIFVALVGTIVGAVVGAVLGGISGGLAGLATGALTVIAFFPITHSNVRRFRMFITGTGVVITAAVALMLGPVLFEMLLEDRAGGDLPGSWLVQALLPALLAGVAAWWASRHIAEWYEDEYLDSSGQTVG